MFRIIAENQNHILIEGIIRVKSFSTDYISVYLKDTLLEVTGKRFLIDKLGEGYIQVCGEISEIRYSSQKND
jgi:hypothetical protein